MHDQCFERFVYQEFEKVSLNQGNQRQKFDLVIVRFSGV